MSLHPESAFATPDGRPWRRSTYCGGSGTCVEVGSLADADRTVVARDAKHGAASPVLSFSRVEWGAFVSRVKNGAHDL